MLAATAPAQAQDGDNGHHDSGPWGPNQNYIKGQGYRDPQGRVPVEVGIRLIGLSDIDSKEETFTIEAILYVNWSDDWGPEYAGWTEQSVDEKLRSVTFRPAVEFENGRGTRKRYGLLLNYDPEEHRIEYEERFTMEFSNELDFTRFPFDEQDLSIKILINGGKEEDIDMRIEEFTYGLIDEAEWFTTADSYSSTIEHNIIPYDIKDPHATERDVFPRARFNIHIQRRSGFYLWRVLLPLLLITLVSWSMFWMERGDLSDRLGASFTALLTVVAYNLILGDILPRIAYLTYLDALITMTYVWLSAGVLESVLVAVLHRGSEQGVKRAAWIDGAARLFFPLTYVAGVAVVTSVFL